MKQFTQEIREATANIMKVAREHADHDTMRPEYHFHSPSQWMDDPNGIIYHKGWYHMMYSLNPDSATDRAGMVYKTGSNKWDPSDPDWTGGITVWGHARSKDLVHWEHLPVALFPDRSRDEYYIWFGCTAINDEQVPVAIYTSVGYKRNPTDSAEQWIAFGDADLITWQTGDEENPILTEAAHGGTKIWEWRDPFLFRHAGKAYLILGGKQDAADGGKAVALLYEATDKRFTQWAYKGIMFEYPDANLRSVECPNFVKIGDKWVLLLSSHGKAEYFVGDMDFDTCTFTTQSRGMVDHSTNFYATNVLEDGRGRQLMWGAVEGFQQYKPSGWNGINSLPREISVDDKLRLVQRVPEELHALRGEKTTLSGNAEKAFDKATLEIALTVPTGETGTLDILSDGKVHYTVAFDGQKVSVGPYTVQLDAELPEQRMTLYVDKSVAELFVNEREVVTVTMPPCRGETTVRLRAAKTAADIAALKTEGLFTADC